MDGENNLDNDTAEAVGGEPAPTQSNLPLIITLVALLTYFGFQTFALLAERGNLGHVKSSQENALQEAQKIQSQFRTLVTKTGELADKGHTGAKMVMEGLQRQGMAGAPPAARAPAPDKAEVKPEVKAIK